MIGFGIFTFVVSIFCLAIGLLGNNLNDGNGGVRIAFRHIRYSALFLCVGITCIVIGMGLGK